MLFWFWGRETGTTATVSSTHHRLFFFRFVINRRHRDRSDAYGGVACGHLSLVSQPYACTVCNVPKTPSFAMRLRIVYLPSSPCNACSFPTAFVIVVIFAPPLGMPFILPNTAPHFDMKRSRALPTCTLRAVSYINRRCQQFVKGASASSFQSKKRCGFVAPRALYWSHRPRIHFRRR